MQITDAVVAARILNATLVVPILDQKSFWKDARSVSNSLPFWKQMLYFFFSFFKLSTTSRRIALIFFNWALKYFVLPWSLCYSDFADIFDVDWFIATLRKDVKIIKQLPEKGGKIIRTPYTMRVPRKCTPRCYESRVLPALTKKHVSYLQ